MWQLIFSQKLPICIDNLQQKLEVQIYYGSEAVDDIVLQGPDFHQYRNLVIHGILVAWKKWVHNI